MIVDDRLEYVKNYVEHQTGIKDISSKKKTNDYVFARCVYYAICIEHVKSSQDRCARLVNKDHASLIHAMNNTYPSLSDWYLDIIDSFNPDAICSIDESDRSTYDALLQSEVLIVKLKKEVNRLNAYIDKLKDDEYTAKLTALLDELTFEQELNVKSRINAIITMETRKKQYKRKQTKV